MAEHSISIFNPQFNSWKQLVDMPSHFAGHKSAIVTGRKHGREVLMTLGTAGEAPNYKTQMYNLKNSIWRVGTDFPQEDNGNKIDMGDVSEKTFTSA